MSTLNDYELAKKALISDSSTKNIEAFSDSCLALGEEFENDNKLDDAIKYYKEAYDLLISNNELKDGIKMAYVSKALGNALLDNGDVDFALDVFDISYVAFKNVIDINHDLKLLLGFRDLCKDYAEAHDRNGEVDIAIKYALECKEINEQIIEEGDRLRYVIDHGYICDFLVDLYSDNDREKMLDNLREAVECWERDIDFNEEIKARLAIAYYYLTLEDLERLRDEDDERIIEQIKKDRYFHISMAQDYWELYCIAAKENTFYKNRINTEIYSELGDYYDEEEEYGLAAEYYKKVFYATRNELSGDNKILFLDKFITSALGICHNSNNCELYEDTYHYAALTREVFESGLIKEESYHMPYVVIMSLAADALYNMEYYDEAIKCYNYAREYYNNHKLDSPKRLLEIISCIGDCYYKLEDNTEIRNYYLEEYDMAKELYSKSSSEYTYELARATFNMSRVEDDLEYRIEALGLAKKCDRYDEFEKRFILDGYNPEDIYEWLEMYEMRKK